MSGASDAAGRAAPRASINRSTSCRPACRARPQQMGPMPAIVAARLILRWQPQEPVHGTRLSDAEPDVLQRAADGFEAFGARAQFRVGQIIEPGVGEPQPEQVRHAVLDPAEGGRAVTT